MIVDKEKIKLIIAIWTRVKTNPLNISIVYIIGIYSSYSILFIVALEENRIIESVGISASKNSGKYRIVHWKNIYIYWSVCVCTTRCMESLLLPDVTLS